MTDWWEKQILRADQLAAQANGSGELLRFYARLLRAQQQIYETLRSRPAQSPSGELERDLAELREILLPLIRTVAEHGPDPLKSEAKDLLEFNDESLSEMLLKYWRNPSDIQFFGKACLQPYLRWVAETDALPGGRVVLSDERCCPFCGGNPQVSFLDAKEPSAESGNRYLICATCLSSWKFRRVVCVNCGEERPEKLAYFHSPEFDHVRIEACDTCRHYLKGVDLTRFGLAAPIVDEVGAAPLDLWAREHGFEKIELNLVGM
jgi:formate dehydrogenase maturation protein FdhE